MGFDFYLGVVLVLGGFGVLGLVVGVTNDAVNFLNAAVGSRVATRRTILFIAALGILAGVTFSGGMMEVARKGIFHPNLFTMPNLLTIFVAVMVSDVILLDTFSSHGLPTSTTVSIVFELLGASVAVSLLKIVEAGGSVGELVNYINTGKAIVIVGGIFLAVVAAFVAGAVVQFLSRLLFSFDYHRSIRRCGALWGGVAMAAVTYFILIKGAKGASFMTPENVAWIKGHTWLIMASVAAVSAVILQGMQWRGINVFKPIVLAGTFALAMAFAANDLVNFIGVPMAGFHAYQAAAGSADPVHGTMEALAGKVPASTWLLLVAGLIMAVTLRTSKKVQTVISTSVDLSQQDEGIERFGASYLSRAIVRGALAAFAAARALMPRPVIERMARQFDTSRYHMHTDEEQRPSFDLLRAAVNILVASVLISYGTAHKLPLSTTYVTFMVAMGCSFADRAWGRDSAVYRVAGVLTVVGGWLLTALAAFACAGVLAVALHYGKGVAVVALVLLVVVVIRKNHWAHARRARLAEQGRIFNLRKVTDISEAVSATFAHISELLETVTKSLDRCLDGLFSSNVYVLREEEAKAREARQWANIIMANAFKSLRLLQREKTIAVQKRNYLQVVRRLQKLSNGYGDIVERCYEHVANNHSGLLKGQVEDLRVIKECFLDIMREVGGHIASGKPGDIEAIDAKAGELKRLSGEMQHRQLDRIETGEAKTRLSILFFALTGDLYMLANQGRQLLRILDDSFKGVETHIDLYTE